MSLVTVRTLLKRGRSMDLENNGEINENKARNDI